MTLLQPAFSAPTSPASVETGKRPRIWRVAMAYVAIVAVAAIWAGVGARDYVGVDNDDAMRLIEVRDLLAGQNWFDTTQYRLGLEGGTLMHWSRLVDLPVATLIALFGLFLTGEAREAAALFVWPILLIVPVIVGVGRTCFQTGGRQTMHVGLVLVTMLLIGNARFQPGSIDHHNVQFAIVALLVAGLTQPRPSFSGHPLAGIMAGLMVAIGAETTPLVAVSALIVALRWAWHGEAMAGAARAFGLCLAATVSAAFLLTMPPHLHAMVTCDNLSLGFLAPTVTGGLALSLSASFTSRRRRTIRMGALVLTGCAVAAITLAIAPECLQSPLATLDPLLKTLWLDNVLEAQSIFGVASNMTSYLGYSYAVGILAVLVCGWRVWRGDRRELHLVLLALCLPALAIGMVQVRGTSFSNFLGVFPLALAISDLRTHAHREPKRVGAELRFAALFLLSIPSVWGAAAMAGAALMGSMAAVAGVAASACSGRDDIAPLAAEPDGVVAAPSNLGASILRFTGHRVLSGPYHRNQAGMLAELRIGLAPAAAAKDLLKRDGVTVLAYCADDSQTAILAGQAPDGLYAALGRGQVPGYLTPLGDTAGRMLKIYRVTP